MPELSNRPARIVYVLHRREYMLPEEGQQRTRAFLEAFRIATLTAQRRAESANADLIVHRY